MTTRTAFCEPEDFTRSEGLRTLLNRLHEGGPGAWQSGPVVADLMAYAADKYGALARKHGLDPWEAASAAFDVMRTKAARTANDPWPEASSAAKAVRTWAYSRAAPSASRASSSAEPCSPASGFLISWARPAASASKSSVCSTTHNQ